MAHLMLCWNLDAPQTHLVFNRNYLAQLNRMTWIMGMTLQTGTRLPEGMLVTHSFTYMQITPKWKHLIILMIDQMNCRLSPAAATFLLRFFSIIQYIMAHF